LEFTHAWLPQDQFDEVHERNGWIFARYRDGYLALRSQRDYHWQTEDGEDKNREVIAPGKKNIWICELGRRAEDGEFSTFVQRILDAPLEFSGRSVRYTSPSQGELRFGWRGPLRVNGKRISLGDFPRYDNPYVNADFPPETISLNHGGHRLTLDWSSTSRMIE